MSRAVLILTPGFPGTLGFLAIDSSPSCLPTSLLHTRSLSHPSLSLVLTVSDPSPDQNSLEVIALVFPKKSTALEGSSSKPALTKSLLNDQRQVSCFFSRARNMLFSQAKRAVWFKRSHIQCKPRNLFLVHGLSDFSDTVLHPLLHPVLYLLSFLAFVFIWIYLVSLFTSVGFNQFLTFCLRCVYQDLSTGVCEPHTRVHPSFSPVSDALCSPSAQASWPLASPSFSVRITHACYYCARLLCGLWGLKLRASRH